MIIGSHVSFKKDTQLLGSLEEALSYNANTFMIYTGAPQNTKRLPIDKKITLEAHKIMTEKNISKNDIIVHAPYIINLAKINEFNIEFLNKELERVKELGFNKLVLHPGSYVELTKDQGINNIINNLNKLKRTDVLILLETMAGKGTEIGVKFEEIKKIIDNVNYELGVCLDTCHINDAGYDLNNIDNILKEFNDIIGLDKLKCIHVNDSKNDINSNKDRHENIGYGKIGFENLIKILNHEKLKNIPKILETPYVKDDLKSYPPYKFEIDMILNNKFNENLKEDIINYYK